MRGILQSATQSGKRHLAMAAVATIALLMAACGGGGGGDNKASPTSTTGAAPTATTGAAPTATTGGGGGQPGGGQPSPTTGGTTAVVPQIGPPVSDIPLLEVSGQQCQALISSGIAVASGNVKNTSQQTLGGLIVIASWYSAAGEFVRFAEAPLKSTSLAPGASDSFSIFQTASRPPQPEMKVCKVQFKNPAGQEVLYSKAS